MWGEDDKAEKDNGKMTFYCPLSVWVAGSSPSNKRKVYEYCLICVWAWLIESEDFFLAKREGGGVSVIECFQS